MMSVAAGMALEGKVPFCCTFGVFAAGRAWNQLSISVSYMDLNVNIAGTHGGISVGPDGATHQALEEITLMRALPNMMVVVPADAIEAKKSYDCSCQYSSSCLFAFHSMRSTIGIKKKKMNLLLEKPRR